MSKACKAVQDSLKEYFQTPAGKVSWQDIIIRVNVVNTSENNPQAPAIQPDTDSDL